MNIARVVVLGIAVMAAGGAIIMVRAGTGANKAPKAAVEATTPTEDVLVASADVGPGQALDPQSVRWQAWPKTGVAPSFIIKTKQPDSAKAIAGLIVRSPLVSGQPISDSNTVHADTKGFMAATLGDGMRAISLSVSDKTGAGGFILPNDRVDVILTRDMGGNAKNFQSETLLKDVRVLAIDQVIQQGKDQQAVVGHTATLELTPKQTELMAQAEQIGVISLALRRLGDSDGMPVTVERPRPVLPPDPARIAAAAAAAANSDGVRIYKAGALQANTGGGPGGRAPAGQQQAAGEQQVSAAPGAGL